MIGHEYQKQNINLKMTDFTHNQFLIQHDALITDAFNSNHHQQLGVNWKIC